MYSRESFILINNFKMEHSQSVPLLFHRSKLAQDQMERGQTPLSSFNERPRFVKHEYVLPEGLPTPQDGIQGHNLATKQFKHYKGCPCHECKNYRAEPDYLQSLANLHNKRVGHSQHLQASLKRPKVFPGSEIELMNGKLIAEAKFKKTETMNNYWKDYWREKYKNKSTQRTLKTMAKLEKYKYYAFPDY